MADVDTETLGILDEIQVLVSDKLQVVSYKWLSRNFSVSSNHAKRLLQEFVEKYGNGFEVLYSLSGWLKDNPQIYHIRLVSGLGLAEAKCKFGDCCSVHVYSVQASIPNDPAALWSSEFVQAEELFDQPSNIENCLRDNRFCGVSNSFVKRNATEESGSVALQPPKIGQATVLSKTSGEPQAPVVPRSQQGEAHQPSPKFGGQSANALSIEGKSGNNIHAESLKPPADKTTAAPVNKKKVQNEKTSSGAGGSLANLWGRASAKTKPTTPSAEIATVAPVPTGTAEAQICAHEALDGACSDDEGRCGLKRASNGENNRKRRFVFDSDGEDDDESVVDLAPADPPKKQILLESKVTEAIRFDFEEKKGERLEVKKEITRDDSNLGSKVDSAAKNNSLNWNSSEKDKSPPSGGSYEQMKEDRVNDASSSSPKRKKVLKTRIDERGREVTEVVWEGEDIENKKAEKNAAANSSTENRPAAANRVPASGTIAPSNPVSNAGSKKTGKGNSKDSKQGNILSFFKKI